MGAYVCDPAFPTSLGSGDDAFVGLIEVANQHFPGFIKLVVDGGAGVGNIVERVLKKCPDVKVIAYEPLPENAKILRTEFQGSACVEICEAALGNRSGIARFEVPTKSREGIENTPWIPGTSAEGALRRHGLVKTSKLIVKKIIRWDPRPSIPVRVVRLDFDLDVPPDFIKLDLQGGEPEAIQGLGHFLADTKVVKLEVELFGSWRKNGRRSINMLGDAGFGLFVEDLVLLVPQLTDEFRAFLAGMGVEIVREMRLYGPSDPNLLVMGKWPDNRPLPIRDMRLTPEFANRLTAEQALAFQVDVVALNNRYSDQWKSVIAPDLLHQAGMLPV